MHLPSALPFCILLHPTGDAIYTLLLAEGSIKTLLLTAGSISTFYQIASLIAPFYPVNQPRPKHPLS